MQKSRRVMSGLGALAAIGITLSLASGITPHANAQASTPAPTMSATAVATQSPLTGTPIKIGAALALTSSIALFGTDQKAGIDIGVQYFNDHGGVNGHPIQVVYQDTAGDAPGAINAFNALLTDNQIVALIGPSISTQAFAADPLANKAGVPVMAILNLAAGIPQIGSFVTRVSAPSTVVSPSAIKAAVKLDPTIKNVAVFYAQDDAFSKSESATFQQAIKDAGLNMLPVQTFLTTDRDFTSQVTSILPQSPDLVVISGLATDSGTLVKQLRDLGYTKLIVGGDGLNTSNIFPICAAACDGIIVAQAYSPQYDSPINNDFRAAFKAAHNGEDPGQDVAQAFTGLQVYVEALRALDSKTPLSGLAIADLRKALKDQVQSGQYNTPLGPISFTSVKNANGDPAGADVNQSQFYIARIKMNADGKTGQFVFIQ